MKCELTAALLHSPKILFLDEPTIGLDVVSQNNIREFLKRYNREKKITIILTSHYMDDVAALCERVVIINYGELIYDGGLRALLDEHVDHKILEVTFTEDLPKDGLAKYVVIKELSERRVVLEVKKDQAKKVAAEILT